MPHHHRDRLARHRRPGFRYIELGPDYHDQLDPGRKTRDKIRQLEKLNPGMTVTLTPRPESGGQAPAA